MLQFKLEAPDSLLDPYSNIQIKLTEYLLHTYTSEAALLVLFR